MFIEIRTHFHLNSSFRIAMKGSAPKGAMDEMTQVQFYKHAAPTGPATAHATADKSQTRPSKKIQPCLGQIHRCSD